MTKQNYLDIIIPKVQEACPELMELTFGCVVKSKNQIAEEGFYIGTFINADYIQFPRFSVPQCINKKELPFFEILGHEPQLHHVLRAMGKLKIDLVVSPSFREKDMAVILPAPGIDPKKFPEPTYCMYDLSKSLRDQSVETLAFIAGVLE